MSPVGNRRDVSCHQTKEERGRGRYDSIRQLPLSIMFGIGSFFLDIVIVHDDMLIVEYLHVIGKDFENQ